MDVQTIQALVTLCVGVSLAGILYALYRWLLSRSEKNAHQVLSIILEAIGIPLIVTILIVTFYVSAGLFAIPAEYQWVLSSAYLNVVYIIIGSWIVASFLKDIIDLYGKRKAMEREDRSGDRLIHFFSLSIHYIVWFAGFLLILHVLSIDITPILAGAGLVSLVVGLAAKDFLANFLGGVVIATDQPFRIGDRIRIEGYIGDVISIGSRSTRLKTPDNQVITVPNRILAENIITNYSEPDISQRVQIPVGVAYGTDVIRVKELLTGIAQKGIAEGIISADPAPSVSFLEFAESNLNFELFVWTPDFHRKTDVLDYVNSHIDQVFLKEGIEILFSQQMVHPDK